VDLFKYAAIEIARQLTIIDYFEFFRKIQARELLSGAWMKPDKEKRAQGVIQLIRRFNNVRITHCEHHVYLGFALLC